MKGKRIFILLAAFSLLLFSRCENEDMNDEVDCYWCYEEVPDSSELAIWVTINSENRAVPLEFYRGAYEDGELDWVDTAYENSFYLYSEVGMKYTVLARYKSGTDSIIAFDSEKMTVYKAHAECGNPCYIIENYILDLRLARENK